MRPAPSVAGFVRASVVRAFVVGAAGAGLAIGATAALLSNPAQAARPPNDKTITIDLQGADIVNVIRLIGDVSGKNVVVADDVKGKVTVKLKNVGWRTALNIILKSNGSGVVEEDNILWVAPQARIDAMEQDELDRGAERELKGPLYTRVIAVNNAQAADLVVLVKPMLSPRGTITHDARTNVLIVRDIAGSFALRAGD